KSRTTRKPCTSNRYFSRSSIVKSPFVPERLRPSILALFFAAAAFLACFRRTIVLLRDKIGNGRYTPLGARPVVLQTGIMDLSDDEILRRVQRGERTEYLEIFDRYYARIEGYAQHQLRNAETARDIASETFLRAYRHVDSFRIGEQMSYLGYLFL